MCVVIMWFNRRWRGLMLGTWLDYLCTVFATLREAHIIGTVTQKRGDSQFSILLLEVCTCTLSGMDITMVETCSSQCLHQSYALCPVHTSVKWWRISQRSGTEMRWCWEACLPTLLFIWNILGWSEEKKITLERTTLHSPNTQGRLFIEVRVGKVWKCSLFEIIVV